MYQHILLPTDGSELSARAVREGICCAKSIGARVTALHTTPQFYPSQMPAHSIIERAREHEERTKEQAARALGAIEGPSLAAFIGGSRPRSRVRAHREAGGRLSVAVGGNGRGHPHCRAQYGGQR